MIDSIWSLFARLLRMAYILRPAVEARHHERHDDVAMRRFPIPQGMRRA